MKILLKLELFQKEIEINFEWDRRAGVEVKVSISGRDRPNSLKQEVTAPVPKTWQQVWVSPL